jgi:hypothetical protein
VYNIVLALQLERGKLYCTSIDERVNELSLGVEEYLKYLVPAEETENSAALAGSSDISLSRLKLLPVVDQVRNLLKEGMFEIRCTADMLLKRLVSFVSCRTVQTCRMQCVHNFS